MRNVFYILIFIFLLASPAFAIPSYQDKYVNDYVNIFTSAQINELRTLLLNVETNTTAEMTVLTVNSVEGMAMGQYAQEVFDEWEIGKADKDNGLLILYAKQEDKIWVQTGYGLEGILTDSKVGAILDETFVPMRANNNSALGIVLAARGYARVINENADEVRSGNAGKQYEFDPLYVFIIIFLIFFMIIPVAVRLLSPKCKKCRQKMKLKKIEDGYEIYECKNGHRLKRKRRSGGWIFFVGGFGGGSSGGFGGGRSGGGGAGR